MCHQLKPFVQESLNDLYMNIILKNTLRLLSISSSDADTSSHKL